MKLELTIKKLFYFIFRIVFRNKNIEGALDKNNIKNILILRYDAIGDMVVTVPAIRQLHYIAPKANIDVLCSKFNLTIIENEEGIRNTTILQNRFFNLISQLFNFRRNNYNLIISLVTNKNTKSGLIANFIGKKNCVKATIAHNNRTNIYSALYNKQIDLNEYRFKITMLEIQSLLINKLFDTNYELKDSDLLLNISNENIEIANEIVSKLDEFIIYNISSGNTFRTFSIEKNVELLNKILEEDKIHNYLLIYGPNDKEKAQEIFKRISLDNLFLSPQISIMQVSSVISKSKLVFTPDTSIVHIASSFKVPIFMIFSTMATNIREWYPYNSTFKYVKTESKVPIEEISNDKILNNYFSFLHQINS